MLGILTGVSGKQVFWRLLPLVQDNSTAPFPQKVSLHSLCPRPESSPLRAKPVTETKSKAKYITEYLQTGGSPGKKGRLSTRRLLQVMEEAGTLPEENVSAAGKQRKRKAK